MNASIERAAERIYHRVWRVLAEWFKVPHEPPTLPTGPGDHLDQFRPAPGYLRYLKLFFWIGLVAFDLVLTVLWLASFAVSPLLGALLAVPYLVVAILPDIIVYVGIHLRYDTTWYVLSNRSVRIRREIWTITETTITFENVQDVKIERGPVQRFYGISDIIIQTAGGGGGGGGEGASTGTTHVGHIEGVADAPRIRDLIMSRVRQSRTAGLGDEHVSTEAQHTRVSQPAWSPAHLEALRDIRQSLIDLRHSTN